MSNLKGMSVIDKEAKDIGKVDDVEFNSETGKIEDVIISLKSGLFSKDQIIIKYSDIDAIGDYLVLSIDLPKKSEQVKAEKD